jgi:hypothetical protein
MCRLKAAQAEAAAEGRRAAAAKEEVEKLQVCAFI